MITAYIALGSNLQNPKLQIQTALQEINAVPQTQLIQAASLYWNKPMGPQDQPDFLNTVCEIKTELQAQNLLEALQSIEIKHERVRTHHWGPRTLDLDLLLYGSEMIKQSNLVIPHPELKNRPFVLYPLFEIAPQLIFPDHVALKTIVEKLSWEYRLD